MSKILVTFGDSWVYGSELPPHLRNQQVFGNQLTAIMGYDTFINVGESGTGIGQMTIALDDFLRYDYDSSNEYFFVFGITTLARSLGRSCAGGNMVRSYTWARKILRTV